MLLVAAVPGRSDSMAEPLLSANYSSSHATSARLQLMQNDIIVWHGMRQRHEMMRHDGVAWDSIGWQGMK